MLPRKTEDVCVKGICSHLCFRTFASIQVHQKHDCQLQLHTVVLPFAVGETASALINCSWLHWP